MLIRYRDLLTLKITTSEAAEHRVADVLVDDDLALAYVVAEFRGWRSEGRTVVRAADFAAPDVGAGTWPATLAQEDIRPAPEPAARDPAGCRAEAEALRAAGVADGPCSVGPGLFDADAGLPSGRIHALGRLIGAKVAGSDREAGQLLDVLIDMDARRVTALVVETGLPVGEHQRVVPVRMLDEPDWATPELRLNCPADRVDESPDLHEVPLERKWWNAVLAYYGL